MADFKSRTHLFIGEMKQSDERQRHRQVLSHRVRQPGPPQKETENRRTAQKLLIFHSIDHAIKSCSSFQILLILLLTDSQQHSDDITDKYLEIYIERDVSVKMDSISVRQVKPNTKTHIFACAALSAIIHPHQWRVMAGGPLCWYL